jgi:hypothetical protein
VLSLDAPGQRASRSDDAACTAPPEGGAVFAFAARRSVVTVALASLLNSLVRVSRRVVWDGAVGALRRVGRRTATRQSTATVRAQNPAVWPAANQRWPAGHLVECTLGSAVPIASLPAISRTFDSFFKVLFIFPSRYLFAIGLSSVFSLRWSLPPALDCNPKQPDSWPGMGVSPPARTGLSPSLATVSTVVRTGGLRAQPGSKLQLGAQWAQITSLGSSHFTRSYWGNPC